MLRNINLNNSDFDRLKLAVPYREGGEANIYESGNGTLYKVFVEPSNRQFCGMSDNKFQKIKEIERMNLRNSSKPISTICHNKELLGYEMEFDQSYKELTPWMFRKTRIFYLEMVRDILKYYEANGILYGDIRANNILVNKANHDIIFIDMDNVCLKEYPMDLVDYNIAPFTLENDMLDPRVHSYMHNLLTLKLLNYIGDSYDDILLGIKNGTYPKGFTNVRETLNKMLDPSQFKEDYIIQYVKK